MEYPSYKSLENALESANREVCRLSCELAEAKRLVQQVSDADTRYNSAMDAPVDESGMVFNREVWAAIDDQIKAAESCTENLQTESEQG